MALGVAIGGVIFLSNAQHDMCLRLSIVCLGGRVRLLHVLVSSPTDPKDAHICSRKDAIAAI